MKDFTVAYLLFDCDVVTGVYESYELALTTVCEKEWERYLTCPAVYDGDIFEHFGENADVDFEMFCSMIERLLFDGNSMDWSIIKTEYWREII